MDDWKQDEEKASETEKRKLQDEKVKAQKIRQASMETMSSNIIFKLKNKKLSTFSKN